MKNSSIVIKFLIISSLIFFSNAANALESYIPGVHTTKEELFGDEIFMNTECFQLNLDKSLPSSYKQTLETPKQSLEYQKGGISLFSKSSKSLNDYMVEDYKSTTGATLNPGGRLSITGGMEVTYQNPDASINSKKLYLTPSLKLNKDISFTFANKFNQDSKIYENEVGLRYSPSMFKNSSFNITAGTVFDEEAIKSQKLKFSTDLFMF